MSQCVAYWDSSPCQDGQQGLVNDLLGALPVSRLLAELLLQNPCQPSHLPWHPPVLSGISEDQSCCLRPLAILGSQVSVGPKLGVMGHHQYHILEGQVCLLQGWVSSSLREKKQVGPIHHDMGLLPVLSPQGGFSEFQDNRAKLTFPPFTSVSSFLSMPSWPSHIPALMDATNKEGC